MGNQVIVIVIRNNKMSTIIYINFFLKQHGLLDRNRIIQILYGNCQYYIPTKTLRLYFMTQFVNTELKKYSRNNCGQCFRKYKVHDGIASDFIQRWH